MIENIRINICNENYIEFLSKILNSTEKYFFESNYIIYKRNIKVNFYINFESKIKKYKQINIVKKIKFLLFSQDKKNCYPKIVESNNMFYDTLNYFSKCQFDYTLSKANWDSFL